MLRIFEVIFNYYIVKKGNPQMLRNKIQGLIKFTKRSNPIMCHTERAGFATDTSSTTTSFHNSFPTKPNINIASKKASKNATKSTYALRRSLESEEAVKPSTAALHTVAKPILKHMCI